MEVVSLPIPDVKLITPRRIGDARGFFSETFSRRHFAEAGLIADFTQDNHSLSRPAGTVRGLHFQRGRFAQAKLVRVLRGAVFDVVLDIRPRSPSYGHHVTVALSAAAGAQLLIPEGFAHGFCTTEPDTEVFYKVNRDYAPGPRGRHPVERPRAGHRLAGRAFSGRAVGPRPQVADLRRLCGGREMKVLVTGGAGFIGSAFIRHIHRNSDASIVNVDALTYAANPAALEDVARSPRYRFEKADIADAHAMTALIAGHRPDAIVNIAAETHVDRSIDGPAAFIQTNIVGTFEPARGGARSYWSALPGERRAAFRFHHVSTDEVFGSLGTGRSGLCRETRRIGRTRPMPRARPPPTISSAPGTRPTACRW